MAKTKRREQEQPEPGETGGEVVHMTPPGAGDSVPDIPIRTDSEASPIVIAAAQTISGCSDSEVKQYIAGLDHVVRQVAIQYAEIWKKVCRNAELVHKEGESAAKVSIATKVTIDLTNPLMLDVKIKTSLGGVKTVTESEHKEDLRQVEFSLVTPAT